jgi:LPXTG-motif cell wall-anchored protein
MLESYSVKVNNEDTNTYTWKNDGTDAFTTVYKYTDKNGKVQETTDLATFLSGATNIVNTNIGTLPSTGGMGTVLFTVAGAAIMALALFLLFGGKKKRSQAQK